MGSAFASWGSNPIWYRLSRSTTTKEEFFEAANDRVYALARAQTLLSKAEWKHIPLRQVLESELDVVGDKEVELKGKEVMLSPRIVENLAIIVHELITNAIKHGAFSSGVGVVHVEWHSDEVLHLTWRESGGPPPMEKSPTGFGTTLIRDCMTTLGGTVSFDYPASGLECRLDIPLPK